MTLQAVFRYSIVGIYSSVFRPWRLYTDPQKLQRFDTTGG